MKTISKYILMAAVALMAAACQEGLDQISTEEGMGNVTLNISTKEHTRAGDDFSPEELRVRIYDKDNRLVRLYTDINDIPEKIALVAGDYTFKVEARDKKHTTAFKGSEVTDYREKIYYIGEKEVKVAAGQSAEAEIGCDPQHVRVGVVLDEGEGENKLLSQIKINLAAMDINGNDTAVDNLKKADFDAAAKDASGADRLDFAVDSVAVEDLSDDAYFLLPEDEAGNPAVETIAWAITGKHTVKAETEGDPDVVTAFDRAGQIVVQKGKAYELQFRYSQLPDGSITVTVTVDDTVDGKDDKFTFKPEPEITPLEENDWTEDAADNVYVVGTSISFKVTSINKINGFGVNEIKVWDKGTIASGYEDWMTVTETPDSDGKDFTVKVNPEFFATLPGGTQNFHFAVYDGATEVGKFKTTFKNQGLVIDGVDATTFDMWTNKANFSAIVTAESVSSVVIKYKNVNAGEDAWNEVTANVSNGRYVAESLDPWIMRSKDDPNPINANHTVYDPDTTKGFYAGNTYEYQLYVNGSAYGPKFTKTLTTTQTIPYANFEEPNLACWGNDTGVAPYWGSGNNSFTDDDPLCRQATYKGMTGNYCARLSSCAAGFLGITMLAAGNVFTGTFNKPSTTGTVSFGLKYTWDARPTAIKLKYWGRIGNVDRDDKNKGLIDNGQPDQASIYVAIVDWDTRHKTTSGTDEASGVWSVEGGADAVLEGKIIGYGVVYPTGTTPGDSMVELEIPIYYYDKVAKPREKYTLVISAATSRYGDYMNGCSDSDMYVDDFQWVY